MADELRQEILTGSLADGSTSSNALSEFRNDSSTIIFIRKLYFDNQITTAAPDERTLCEISKSPTIASLTNNNVFFTFPQALNMPSTGATPVDGATQANGTQSYGKGQLTLEPNESLFVNISKTSGGIASFRYVIHYHF